MSASTTGRAPDQFEPGKRSYISCLEVGAENFVRLSLNVWALGPVGTVIDRSAGLVSSANAYDEPPRINMVAATTIVSLVDMASFLCLKWRSFN